MNQETRDFLWEKFTSRKLHIMILGFISATVLLYHGYLTPQIWSNFVQFTFAVYVVGNSFEHFANQGIKLGKPKPMKESEINQQKNDK